MSHLSAKTGEMLEALRYAARRYEVNHFIVDSLAKLGMAEDDYNGQKQAIEALTEFAHEMADWAFTRQLSVQYLRALPRPGG